MDLPDRPDWQLEAACRGMDQSLFFPRLGESIRKVRYAQSICQGCPVWLQCLDHAVVNIEPFGIWGGLTERERRKLRKIP